MLYLPAFIGEGRKRSHLSMGQSSEYNLKVTEVDVLNLYGTIKTPNLVSEACTLKRLQDGELGTYIQMD